MCWEIRKIEFNRKFSINLFLNNDIFITKIKFCKYFVGLIFFLISSLIGLGHFSVYLFVSQAVFFNLCLCLSLSLYLCLLLSTSFTIKCAYRWHGQHLEGSKPSNFFVGVWGWGVWTSVGSISNFINIHSQKTSNSDWTIVLDRMRKKFSTF